MSNNTIGLIESIPLKRVLLRGVIFSTIYSLPKALLSETKIDTLICDTLRK
jgi:hypothetical protein